MTKFQFETTSGAQYVVDRDARTFMRSGPDSAGIVAQDGVAHDYLTARVTKDQPAQIIMASNRLRTTTPVVRIWELR